MAFILLFTLNSNNIFQTTKTYNRMLEKKLEQKENS